MNMLPGDYKLKEVLHATHMSRICLVEMEGLDYVAKLPPLDSDHALKRFAHEVQTLKKAAGRHTIPLIDHADDYSWYIMPVATSDLSQVPRPTTLEMALEVLDAITYSLADLHADGEVHRDLKPQNILRLSDAEGDRWVVADFGIARKPVGMTTSDLTRTGFFLGTEGWAAPEQRGDAHRVTPAADVYSAALILGWLLSGRDIASLSREAIYTLRIGDALARATTERPDRRYQSLEEFARACRDQLAAGKSSIGSLVAEGRYKEVVAASLHPAVRKESDLRTLAQLLPQQVKAWWNADPQGIVDSLTVAIEGLVDDHNNVSFAGIVDPILIVSIEVLGRLLRARDKGAHAFAVSVFGGIADIHQFAPAREALELLDTLSHDDQTTMRGAIHEAGAWEFLSEMAGYRFPSKRRTALVQDLANK